MHLNPLVRDVVHKLLDDFDRKILLEPLEYLEFIAVMDGAHYIMTDSGGVARRSPKSWKTDISIKRYNRKTRSNRSRNSKTCRNKI